MLLLVANDPLNSFPLFGEIWVIGREQLDDDIGELTEKRSLHPKQSTVTNSSPQNPSEDITTSFVTREHAISHQKGDAAAVIGDHA